MSLKVCAKDNGSRWRKTGGISPHAALFCHQDGKLTAACVLKRVILKCVFRYAVDTQVNEEQKMTWLEIESQSLLFEEKV